MTQVAYLLLVSVQLIGLLLIAVGWPGIWLQVGSLALFAWATGFEVVGQVTVGLVVFLALLGEMAEWTLGGRYARRYGGGRRAAFGAILGGMVGAIVGMPVPLLGSVFGAMVGSFAGAVLFELSTGRGASPALQVGWGALLGWMIAVAMKASLGVVILVLAMVTAFR